jgi:hypothetical protein
MALMKEWQHERIHEPPDNGGRVRDTVTFQMREPLCRIPGTERAMRGLLRGLFDHRHRRLEDRHSPAPR